MQLTPDLFVLGLLVEAIIYIPLFLVASLFIMKLIDLLSRRVGTIIRYLAFPGVVLHEVCHDLFCRVTGIPIIEHRIFLGKHEGVAGGVIMDATKIRTFTSSFLVAFAPFFILAFALYLLVVFWQILPMHQGLALYFAFCFFIGLSPSRADVRLIVSVAQKRPSQTVLEIGLLTIPVIAAIGYLRFCSVASLQFSFGIFIGIILVGAIFALLLWQLLSPHRKVRVIKEQEPTRKIRDAPDLLTVEATYNLTNLRLGNKDGLGHLTDDSTTNNGAEE
jgi:hypothetical protein